VIVIVRYWHRRKWYWYGVGEFGAWVCLGVAWAGLCGWSEVACMRLHSRYHIILGSSTM